VLAACLPSLQITEKDAAILAHLVDIRTAPLGGEDHGFTLSFHFSENPFFTNTVLTKTYKWANEDEDMLELAKGTPINWAAGKDPTMKVMKKKAKKGGKPLTKLEPCESFFRFFSPPDMPEDEDELTEEDAEALQEAVEADFELGAAIREDIIPQAIAWFTGAAIEAGDDDDEEDDEDDEEDDDEEEDDDDDDDEPRSKGKTPLKGGAKGKAGPPGAAGENPECKQQ
jgi:nucleosome assembly protein 1-like 1